MDYDAIRALFAAQGAAFVYVEFIKADGTLRQMIVQYAATATHVAGAAASASAQQGAATRRANHPNLLNVFDVDRRAIRSINMDTLVLVRSGGAVLYSRPELKQEVA